MPVCAPTHFCAREHTPTCFLRPCACTCACACLGLHKRGLSVQLRHYPTERMATQGWVEIRCVRRCATAPSTLLSSHLLYSHPSPPPQLLPPLHYATRHLTTFSQHCTALNLLPLTHHVCLHRSLDGVKIARSDILQSNHCCTRGHEVTKLISAAVATVQQGGAKVVQKVDKHVSAALF